MIGFFFFFEEKCVRFTDTFEVYGARLAKKDDRWQGHLALFPFGMKRDCSEFKLP